MLLRRAIEGFARLGVPYELSRTQALLANVLPDGDAMLADAIASAEALLGERDPDAAAGNDARRPTLPGCQSASGKSWPSSGRGSATRRSRIDWS